MDIRGHIFKSWEEIPDVSHLYEIEDSYVDTFEHGYSRSISYVSYAMKDDKVVAFGSATYFEDQNYYVDEDESEEERKLWVEGLVSIEKGCGTLVLGELEKWLIKMSQEHNVSHKIINIMSVDNSIGFYEENGYVACYTGPRFAGTGNTRVAKAIGDFDIRLAEIVDYTDFDDKALEWEIASWILLGRRKTLSKFIDIPRDVRRKDYEQYIRNNKFKECVTEDMRKNIIDNLDEMNDH